MFKWFYPLHLLSIMSSRSRQLETTVSTEGQTNKLFVTNIRPDIPLEQIKQKLTGLIAKHGEINYIQLKISFNKRYCYAFVQLKDLDTAKKVLKQIKGCHFEGRSLRVEFQRSNPRQRSRSHQRNSDHFIKQPHKKEKSPRDRDRKRSPYSKQKGRSKKRVEHLYSRQDHRDNRHDRKIVKRQRSSSSQQHIKRSKKQTRDQREEHREKNDYKYRQHSRKKSYQQCYHCGSYNHESRDCKRIPNKSHLKKEISSSPDRRQKSKKESNGRKQEKRYSRTHKYSDSQQSPKDRSYKRGHKLEKSHKKYQRRYSSSKSSNYKK